MITNKIKNSIQNLLKISLAALLCFPAYAAPGIAVSHKVIYKDTLKIDPEINYEITIKNIGTRDLAQISLNSPYSDPEQTNNTPLIVPFLSRNQEVTVQWSDFSGVAYQQDDLAVHLIGTAESEGDGKIDLDVVSNKIGTENE